MTRMIEIPLAAKIDEMILHVTINEESANQSIEIHLISEAVPLRDLSY